MHPRRSSPALLLSALLLPTVLGACSSDAGSLGGGGGDVPFTSYVGTVTFSVSQGPSTQAGTLAVTAELAEHRNGDLDKFTAATTLAYDYTPIREGYQCEPVKLSAPFEVTLQVYADTGSIRGANDPFASKLQLAVSSAGSASAPSARCCLTSAPTSCIMVSATPGLAATTGCAPADFPAYTDRATLAGTGTFTCNGVLPSTLTWSLAGQN